MLKRILALTFLSLTLVATTESARAANLPEPRRAGLVERLGALREPMSRLVRTCQDYLGRLLVRLPIQIEVRTGDTVMRGGGDISALLTRAKYTADQLTGAAWSDVVALDGVTEVHLSAAFPERVEVRVDDVLAPSELMIKSATESDHALVPVTGHVPVVSGAGQLGVTVDIVSDPRSVDRLARFQNGFRVARSNDRVEISQREAFSYVATRDQNGVGRFGGIGIGRATLHLSRQNADLLIFRDGALVHGRLGVLSTKNMVRKLAQISFDDDRVELLKMFVKTLPADRELTAADLSAVVKTMSFSDGEVAAVKAMKSKMSSEERQQAAMDAHDFMTFDDDAAKAVRLLLKK